MIKMLTSSPVLLAIPPSNNLLSKPNDKNFISMENGNHWTSISLGVRTNDFSSVVVAASKSQGSSSRKGGPKLVKLVSEAGTGFFYFTNKPKLKAIPKESRNKKKNTGENLEFRKYDPRVNRHVWFREAKMK